MEDTNNFTPKSPPPPPPPPGPPPLPSRARPRQKAATLIASPSPVAGASKIVESTQEPSHTPPSGPTWYFFYGTLTKPDILSRILDLPTDPVLHAATITGWSLANWGQYKTLISGPPENVVHGYAYLVETAEQMRKLARYETSAYTAHVCTIEFQNEHKDSMTIDGMAFVYAADPEALKTENFDRQLWQQQMGIMMPDVWNKRHGDQE